MEQENIFKKIGSPALEVPDGLREKVIADMENAKLLLEVADLFSFRYGDTAVHIFDKLRKRTNQ